jgi:hypothetical protein
MLHPVGSHTPSVYWRRRLLVLASVILLVILLALTLRAVFGDDKGKPSAADPNPGSTTPVTHPASPGTTNPSTQVSSTGGTASTTGGSTSSTPPAKCTPAQLKVQAVVGKPTYQVGDKPVLTLQVTNSGPAPCAQNVADSQIVLRVYNGASRVWGSHDCQTEPGVDQRTLLVNKPVGFSIVWSGLTAQAGCTGTRQQVGAGTYTLYAALAGHDGKAAQFVIS